MAAPQDDLPWPELGNVSRGATRGNQGQKGVLGPPDAQGRCVLQLRVQPGVLAVRLNRTASDWYRTLEAEVNRALKLTKTYWRKARRRQDYDARADQDHMELHEWLQQLKDKTMSHLEVLMQKGDIQGPPYEMPDDLELTFLRKFIERQAAGIPHNPRVRQRMGGAPFMLPNSLSGGESPSPDSDIPPPRLAVDTTSDSNSVTHPGSSRASTSPTLRPGESMSKETVPSKLLLDNARAALARAQKDTQEAFLRYTACLDAERQARQAVFAAEKRREDHMSAALPTASIEPGSRHSSEDRDDPLLRPRFASEGHPGSNLNKSMLSWAEVDPSGIYDPIASASGLPSAFERDPERASRKRSWEPSPHSGTYGSDELGMPPRKRLSPTHPYEAPFGSTLPHI